MRSASRRTVNSSVRSVAYTLDYARRFGLDRLSKGRAERCLAALEWIDRTLGPRWLVETYGQTNSLGNVTEVIQTQDDWKLVAGLTGAAALLRRLKAINHAQRRAALLELFVIARFVESGVAPVLEPTLASGRRPDCAFAIGEHHVFVEIALRERSQALTEAFTLLGTIAEIAARVAPDRRNSVQLLRAPSAAERAEILAWLRGRTRVRDQLRDLVLYESRPESDETPVAPDARLALERSVALVGRGIWSMPLNDAAADQLIDDEARQLPRNGCGVLCVDITATGVRGDHWEALVRSRLRPTFNTRVAVVVLIARYAGDDSFDTRVRIITNDYAAAPAPTELLEILGRLGSTGSGR